MDRKKKAGVAILISDKIDFEKRSIKGDPEGHFIILKGRIHQEDINIISTYAPNIGTPKYIKKILEDFKKDIDSNTVIVGDFNTPLSKMDISSKQNINKDIVALNNTLDEMDHTDIYRVFHPKEAKYTFFSNVHGTFSKIEHMIGHKTSLNNLKKTEIILSIFLDHKGLKLETNCKEKNPKLSKSWRLNSMLLNNEWDKNEIRKEIKRFLETNKNELTTTQNLRDTAKAVFRGKFIVIQAHLKMSETFQTKNLTLRLQELNEQQ
ncbi:hypothetical protein HJG60_008245 [Phyllostomus discolor]|uniref:Endonuclease/exonuclease/phosphatase domain-containing protein n=1 Tax=Phyllostomus discolor TaxID=89673 RepID=A0A834DLZ6_9CHIR|nr:hypothetical protein HJG60_008245 [Phyllostomus discolor]